MELASIVGPVAEWELRTLSRRGRYFVIRVLYTVFLLGCLAMALEKERWRLDARGWSGAGPKLAEALFNALAIGQLAAIGLLTPGYMAASIAGRREKRTLDELHATDLSDHAIVVGVWFARMAQALSLLLAGLPIFAMLTLLGGIDSGRILFSLFICIGVTATNAALGVAFSVREKTVREAFAAAYTYSILGWIALYVFLMCFTAIGSRSIPRTGDLIAAGALFLFFNFVISAGALNWAIAHLRIDETKEAEEKHAREQEQDDTDLALPAVSDWPVAWKEWHLAEGRNSSKSKIAFLFLFFMELAILSLGVFNDIDPANNRDAARIFLTVIILFLYSLFVIRVAASFGIERERGSWDSLLGSTLTGSEIVHGKVIGGLRLICWLPLLLAPCCLPGLWQQFLSWYSIPLTVWVIVCHLVFLTGVGIRASLTAPTSMAALLRTLGLTAAILLVVQLIVNLLLPRPMESKAAIWWSIGYAQLDPRGPWHSLYAAFPSLAVSMAFATIGAILWRRSIVKFDELAGRSIEAAPAETEDCRILAVDG